MPSDILLTSSQNRFFMTETLVRSIKRNCRFDDLAIHFYVTCGGDHKPYVGDYLDSQTDRVVYDKAHHRSHPPVRWNRKLNSDVAILMDHDMIATGDISGLSSFVRNNRSLAAMMAIENHFSIREWKEYFRVCGVKFPDVLFKAYDGTECPRYFNFGLIACPEDIYMEIGDCLQGVIRKLNRFASHKKDETLAQHAAQVAMAIVVEKLGIPTTHLPMKYNFPNFHGWGRLFKDEFSDVRVIHLLTEKHDFQSKRNLEKFLSKKHTCNIRQKIVAQFKKPKNQLLFV
jgi:hypothetical protein